MEIYDDNKNNKRTRNRFQLIRKSVKAGNLSFEQVCRELGVVDGTFFTLFLSDHQGINILGFHLFTDGEEDVSQFSSEDGAVGLFVENSQTLNEVFKSSGLGVLLDLVEDGHVFLEGDELGSHVFFGWVSEGGVNFGVGGILAEGTDAVSDGGVGDLAFATHVEKAEHFFVISKLCFTVITHG